MNQKVVTYNFMIEPTGDKYFNDSLQPILIIGYMYHYLSRYDDLRSSSDSFSLKALIAVASGCCQTTLKKI